jgi:small subunit ribosomal protein S4
MARFRGPRRKVCRQLGTVLPGITNVAVLKRPYPPGQHGANRRNKPSDFKIRLMEKQKARFHFGILERQFQSYVRKASRLTGPSGSNLVRLLESRLDNLVWRLGLARTIIGARQLVVHGHILVDGRRVDRPSFHVSPGSEIGVREQSRVKPYFKVAQEESLSRSRPTWLDWDAAKWTGKLITAPERSDLPFELHENAIIEFYSQKL